MTIAGKTSYLSGQWVQGLAQSKAVRNPATGELLGEIGMCDQAQIESAFEAAKAAFGAWRTVTAYERAEKLRKLSQLMLQHKAELGELLTREQGKPLPEAIREIINGASFFDWYAEEAKRQYGETIPGSEATQRILVLRQPIGVCAAITPWNFPNSMIARKAAPALAAGCSIVIKPSPETPFSAFAIAALAQEAGIPAGVMNVVYADAEEFAATAMRLEYVRKISFTGSTEVGRILLRQAADSVKRVTCELGGNAPFIVFEDADLTKAVDAAIFAKFRNAGQTCIAVNRFLVQESIAEEFSRRLTERAAKLVVGDGMRNGVDIGPLISNQAVAKVSELVEDALARGATALLGGVPDKASLFVAPTVLQHINASMRLWNEEIFGPIAAIGSFGNESEAIAMANKSIHGLASYVFTQDLSRATRVSEALEFGMVGLNTGVLSYAQAPFGGIKQSGFGREGGRQGLEEYLNIKYVNISAT